jgi:tRNA A-37 threonylcarbamoyl transferase component Bud32
MKGSFSEEALTRFRQLASFSFSEGHTYDFTRCVRADGTHYGTSGKCRKGIESPYKDWPVFAEGAMGTIAKSPDGTRVVKRLKEGREWGPYEVELGQKMGQLGFSPKVHSSGPDHIEMDMVQGKPLWKDYRPSEDEGSMNRTQALQAAKAIRAMHAMGYSHGDMHSQQFLVNGDKVTLVDFGLSKKASEEPRKVIQDLNKISKLVAWDNPELNGDPYVELVRKYRAKYADAKKKKDLEEQVANEYLEELKKL